MKLIKSSYLEQYIKNNKKEAENEFPYIIKKLLQNTVDNITGIDIPSGDNTIQIGFDGIVSFRGVNKYLGDKPANIEIGTNSNYLAKADEDIKKRVPKENENFIFITPYRWNSRKVSKNDWVKEKKEIYQWHDIKIIDASVLEDWFEEDVITSKYLLSKLNIQPKNIYSISEKEREYIQKTERAIKLDFFDYEDKGYERLLSELKKEYYNIIAPTREEGILVTLYYLRKLGKENDVLVIENESTWKEVINKEIVNNGILIPNFFHNDSLEVPPNNTTIFIHDSEELIKESDYLINQRTISNLNHALEIYYKDDSNQIDYEKIQLIVNKSLGKYMPLKRELFKELNRPGWYREDNLRLYLYLFFLNDFKTRDFKLFEQFDIDVKELKRILNKLVKEKDPFIVYYKYRDEYRVVNIYDAIEWLGLSIDEESIEKLCNIARKVLFYLEPKYLPENIENPYYIEGTTPREYSQVVKNGLLKGLIITKRYLEKEFKYSLIHKLDELIEEYYSSIESESQFLSFANIANQIVEFNYDKYLDKIQKSIANSEFKKMFDLTDKDIIFSSNEYCNIIWGIEKAINKKDYIVQAVETLALLSEMKNTNYKNMANTPFNTLKDVFLGWDNLTCLEIDEKIGLLEQLIKKHYELGKKLLQCIFPNNSCTWSPLQKPEFDTYDENKKIKYVKEQKDYFERYYILYLDNYAKKLDDMVCIYKEVYFIDFDCFELIKNKTLELIKESNDEEKFNLKETISEKLRGYKKFHNSAWNLTKNQLEYLTYIWEQLIYKNPIYDYVYVYKYHTLLDDSDLEKARIEALNLLKDNEPNEDFLLERCENKKSLIWDIYEYNHQKKHNIKFIKKLNKYYKQCVEFYLRAVYANERLEDIINIYNDSQIKELPIEDRISILSDFGYNDILYDEVRYTKNEELYWKKLDMYNGEKTDFVYNSCLKYGNYEICLDIICELEDKYDDKCLLLEKMMESNYKKIQANRYQIEKIFESFHDYKKISNFERLAKLEIYYSPILEDNTYFLSKEASKHPSIVAELAELIYKDEDGNFSEFSDREVVVSNCFTKLHNLRIDFDDKIFEWCEEFIKIMKEKKRSQVMFHILGQLLARTGIDNEDQMFPSKNIRRVIEYYKSDELASSFEIEKYNARGMHNIGIGEEEHDLCKKYSEWSKKMKIEYPETSKILKKLAETYRAEAISLREEANYV